MSPSVDNWIDEAPDAQRKQLRELRAIILAMAPNATEALKWGQPCYARRSLFCYLQKGKTHVTLGFQKGALMSDPEGRLEGEGKQMRHIRFGLSDPIDAVQCRALIQEALRLD